MTAPAIEVDDVAKRFRLVHERNSTLKAMIFSGFKRTVHEEFWALNGVSFDVAEGQTYGLIGHNGSGKSTLLKCMARIYRPSRGSITTRGKVSALLELGAGFHPELSGRENVYLNGSILGMSKREVDKRFDGIVEFAGLEQFIDTPVKNYSSGMFVRLGFSVAITVEPDVLLVDEVLAVGDESFQQRCMEKFADLRASGRTVVIVSHSLDTVRSMCDRAAWLDHGTLQKEGQAHDVVSAYLESVRDDQRAHPHVDDGSSPSDDGTAGWQIDEVGFLDESGAEVDVVRSGEPLTVRAVIRVPADQPAAIGFGLYRTDGVHVAGPHTRFDACGPGRQVVEYRIPALSLTGGVYDLTVRVLDAHLQRTHAVRRRAARLDVTPADEGDIGGVVALHGTWKTTTPAAIS
ncbi:MAG TPA: ABC transporter ATP-binding protein [Acidimicrobiales bacterium]|nr:ABC transporter ATP-binding protein [Acidimicrobiales bacterium]